jgi:hypothetical protein
MKANFLSIFIFMTFLQLGFGQAGMNVYVGPSIMNSRDVNFTPKGQQHSGYVIGVNGRLNSDNMYFLLTGEYGTFGLLTSDKLDVLGDKNVSYFKFKVGLGGDIVRLSKNAGIRIKGQGVMLASLKVDETGLLDPKFTNGYEKLNDGSAGVVGGLGFYIGPFTADFSYEYGLLNFINKKSLTKLDFVDFVVGVRF